MSDQQATPMGHGVNQRAQIKMTPDEVDAFIHERRPMSMCSINHDGSIHAIAMWYGFLDGLSASRRRPSRKRSRTFAAIPASPACSKTVTRTRSCAVWSSWGAAEIVEDPERMFELGVSVFERYYGGYTEDLKPFVETMLNKRVVVVLHVDRVVSWDHRKLGLSPTS